MMEVPELVMAPPAKGVPALGRTCIPAHVSVDLRPPELGAVTVTVIAALVTVAVGEARMVSLPLPDPVTVTKTVLPVLTTKPEGTVSTMVPTSTFPGDPSITAGPLNEV